MTREELIKESDDYLARIRIYMDSLALPGLVMKQGLFQKPIIVPGTPPPKEYFEIYNAELKRNIELREVL